MKRLLLATAFAALSLPAMAADLPPYSSAPYYAPAPIFTWTGAYVGADAAFGFGSFYNGGNAYFGNPDGGLFGIEAGYNYQSGPLVVGIEGDLNFGGVAGTVIAPGFSAKGNVNGEGSIRPRVGYAFDHTLIYITGGYTGANLNGSLTDTRGAQSIYANESTFLNGWTIGTGVEFAITRNVSVKAEYLYSNYGSSSTLFSGTSDAVRPSLSMSTLRAGINYHF
jgi:outer membrane immunogenic protein